MKKIIIFFGLQFIMISSLFAGNLKFLGPCSQIPLLEVSFINDAAISLGQMTLDQLEQNSIPYIGTDRGFATIFETAVGAESIEYISSDEFLSYGWCFKVNGVVLEKYADAVALDDSISDVTWFYAYAVNRKGAWIAQCVAAYLRPQNKFCQQYLKH